MHRSSVNKGRSASKFRSRSAKTHKRNVHSPLRGGIRL